MGNGGVDSRERTGLCGKFPGIPCKRLSVQGLFSPQGSEIHRRCGQTPLFPGFPWTLVPKDRISCREIEMALQGNE
jgi:hypothetical protein